MVSSWGVTAVVEVGVKETSSRVQLVLGFSTSLVTVVDPLFSARYAAPAPVFT